jgi:hypothetical protein
VFFGDLGLLAFDWDGQRWRLSLSPFNNMNGHGTSPILEGDLLALIWRPGFGIVSDRGG